MGINQLWPFLKKFSRKVNLREFSSQTVAIDASCWIHRALYVSISERGNRERFGSIFQRYLETVKNAGVRPFVVFDGLPLPAKAAEDERRKTDREDRQKKADERNLTSEEANRLRGQAVAITFDDISTCINICLSEGVKYIVSPYESDAQIASLLANGFADFAITEDSDLLAYGCKKMVVKTSLSGDGEYFLLSDVLDGLKLSMKEFRKACIAAGCDYLKNVKGVGIQRAFQMVASGQLMELLVGRGASEEYLESFSKAEAVFEHQTVFNLGTCSTVPLKKWETNPSADLQYLCGDLLDDLYSSNLAVGNVNTKTGKQTLNKYPLFTITSTLTSNNTSGITSQQNTTTDHDGDDVGQQVMPHGAMKCEITHIDRFSSFQWEIPCFPVMKLEFVRVLFKIGTEVSDGVIQKKVAANTQRGHFICTSHCRIKVRDKDYTVLWNLVATRTGQTSVPNYTSKNVNRPGDNLEIDERDDSGEVGATCLPFKVLGTCYSKSRQQALEEAFEYLYNHNRPVFVKLQAEPDNPIDKHAIAVYVMSSADYEKVGYIASEMTQFVHPALRDSSFQVSVKRIWFSTVFLMIGFYITINITISGPWDKKAVQACSRVK